MDEKTILSLPFQLIDNPFGCRLYTNAIEQTMIRAQKYSNKEITINDISQSTLILHKGEKSMVDFLREIYGDYPYKMTDDIFTVVINTSDCDECLIFKEQPRDYIQRICNSERVYFLTLSDEITRSFLRNNGFTVTKWLTRVGDNRYIGLTEQGPLIKSRESWGKVMLWKIGSSGDERYRKWVISNDYHVGLVLFGDTFCV